jgi:hypothetical protein
LKTGWHLAARDNLSGQLLNLRTSARPATQHYQAADCRAKGASCRI